MQHLDGLHDIVAEVSVELLFDLYDLLLGLFWERVDKICAHDFTPIPYYIIYKGVNKAAEKIQDAVWPYRDGFQRECQ